MQPRLAILYEHPDWFRPLFAELRRQGISFLEWRAEALSVDLEKTDFPDLVLNRMSPSAAFRGHAHAQFATRDLLALLEARRVAVINGSAAYDLEISKIRQHELWRRAGALTPRTRLANRCDLLASAAEGLTFPVLVKPNCGGAGSAIRRFDSLDQLRSQCDSLDAGCDHTFLVQEFIAARDNACYRIEVLDGQILYCVRIERSGAGFNLCPADACQSAARPVFARCEPLPEAATVALSAARLGRLDVCGVEYILDANGQPVFYDLNALSNFVVDPLRILGFDPTRRFVEYISRRLDGISRVY